MKNILILALALILAQPSFGSYIQSASSGGGGAVDSVNGQTGVVTLTTADVSEVTNLYFTTARVIATAITGFSAGAGTVAGTDTLLQAINKMVGNIALKENILTVTAPIVRTVNDLSCRVATGSVSGCLASADWTTFNGKQASGNYITALTGDVNASGPGSVAATVAAVGGKTAAQVSTSVDATLAATTASTVSTIPLRDSSGNLTTKRYIADGGTSTIGYSIASASRSNTVPLCGVQGTSQGFFTYDTNNVAMRASSGTGWFEVGSQDAIFNYTKPYFLDLGGFGGYGSGWTRDSSITVLGNTAATNTTIYTKNVGGGAMPTNGMVYTMRVTGTMSGASTDKVVTAILGTSTFFDSASDLAGVIASKAFTFFAQCARVSATSAECSGELRVDGVAPIVKSTTVTETLANTLAYSLKANATGANDVTKRFGTVKLDL